MANTLDRDALREAINSKDVKVLRWYVEHASEHGQALVGDEDAEARMLYYQLRLQHGNPPPTPSTARLNAASSYTTTATGIQPRWDATPSSMYAASLNAAATPTLSRNHHTPLVAQPVAAAYNDPWLSDRGAYRSQTEPLSLPQASLTVSPRKDLPLVLHHRLTRKLFRSYDAYLPNTPSSSSNVGGVASPKADTSTFLLRSAASVMQQSGSPRTVMLSRKNIEVHEDEERVDIVHLEGYEWQQVSSLHADSYARTLRHAHAQERVALETTEGKERLRISSLHVDLWTGFLHGVETWKVGPAKRQNAMLLNEMVLRTRLTAEEERTRHTIATVHRHEAEHRLSEMRRLRWLEREHHRAAAMHKHLMVALAVQGVEVDAQHAVSPPRAAALALGGADASTHHLAQRTTSSFHVDAAASWQYANAQSGRPDDDGVDTRCHVQ